MKRLLTPIIVAALTLVILNAALAFMEWRESDMFGYALSAAYVTFFTIFILREGRLQ